MERLPRNSAIIATLFGLAGLVVAALPSGALAQSAAVVAKAPQIAAIRAELQKTGRAQVIVELNAAPVSGADPTARTAAKARLRSLQDAVLAAVVPAQSLASRRVKRTKAMPMMALDVSPAELEKLAADARVKRIFPEGFVEPQLAQTVPLIGADALAATGASGSDSVVAVLDSGVQANHPFLAGKVIGEACFSATTPGLEGLCPDGQDSQVGVGAGKPCTVSTRCSHGTYVAGIVAGYNPSSPAKWGVAHRASILSIQIYHYDPVTKKIQARNSDLLLALDHILDNQSSFGSKRIDAVNMSMSTAANSTGACDNHVLATVVGQLRQAGIPTVIAAGNDGSRTMGGAPGCITAAITVGASSEADGIWDGSNMYPMVDVMAPGAVEITSSSLVFVPRPFQAPQVISTYNTSGGTSAAAPHVAGAMAMLRSRYPFATVDELETALESTGRSITDTRPATTTQAAGTLTRPRIQLLQAAAALPKPILSVRALTTPAFAPKNLYGAFLPAAVSVEIRATPGTASWRITGIPSWLTVSVTSGTVSSGGFATVRLSPSAKAASLTSDATTTLIFWNNTNVGQTPVFLPVSIKARPANI